MKNLLTITILFALVLWGCKSRTETEDYKYKGRVMSRNKFIHFLIDLHKYDGVTINLNLDDYDLKRHDSLSYYNYLFKKYNVNYMDLQRTINYYMNDLERFQEIYKVVIDSLKKEAEYLDSLQQKMLKKKNYWTGKKYYSIPSQGYVEDSIPFKLVNPKPGIYELSADIKVYEDDQTRNLQIFMSVLYEDGSGDTVITPIYFKDNQFHRYVARIKVDKGKKAILYGNLLDYRMTYYMHIAVRRIRLLRYEPSEMPWYREEEEAERKFNEKKILKPRR